MANNKKKTTASIEDINKITNLQSDANQIDDAVEKINNLTLPDFSKYATQNDVNKKVDKQPGKILTDINYTQEDKNKLDGLENNSTITMLSELTEDSNHRLVSDNEKQNWNNKSDFTGSYNDLRDKPTIPNITGLATIVEVDNKIENLIGTAPSTLDTLGEISNKLNDDDSTLSNLNTALSNKADLVNGKVPNSQLPVTSGSSGGNGFSGDYNDLINKPDLSTLATNSSVDNKIIELIDDAPEEFNTLKKLSDKITSNSNATTVDVETTRVELTIGDDWFLHPGWGDKLYAYKRGTRVTIQGGLPGINGTSNILTTLPVGYRPPHKLIFVCIGVFSGVQKELRIDVYPDGTVVDISNYKPLWISLTSINFYVE